VRHDDEIPFCESSCVTATSQRCEPLRGGGVFRLRALPLQELLEQLQSVLAP
jgi:hypothetical protein